MTHTGKLRGNNCFNFFGVELPVPKASLFPRLPSHMSILICRMCTKTSTTASSRALGGSPSARWKWRRPRKQARHWMRGSTDNTQTPSSSQARVTITSFFAPLVGEMAFSQIHDFDFFCQNLNDSNSVDWFCIPLIDYVEFCIIIAVSVTIISCLIWDKVFFLLKYCLGNSGSLQLYPVLVSV